jgi:cell division protein FtsQ
MLRKLLKLVGLLLLMAFLIVTLAFTSNESKHVDCGNIEVKFDENDLIKLDEIEITRLAKLADEQLIGKNLGTINAELIEKEVEKNQAILNAEVYKVVVKDSTSYTGILGIKVKHREPAVRIISSSANFYLDKTGAKIPTSANYAANVLVATGYFSEKFAKEQLLPFVLYLNDDEFWKAQAEQIHVEQGGKIVLIPQIGDHLIELGQLDDFQLKLRNMKEFYHQVMANDNWNKYEKINVEYNNQVIAKKKS